MKVMMETSAPSGDVGPRRIHRMAGLLGRLTVRGWIRTLLVSVALLALLLIPRLSDLDALVTPDEPLWIARSANFYEAVTKGDLRDTYQYVHPGVPLMWLGTLGYILHIPDMPDLMGKSLPVRNRAVQDVLEGNGYSILDVLVELRQVVIVASALVVLGLFFCLSKIVDFWIAAAAIAYLSLDPMHIGFTRLLHLDGLSANLVILSVVSFCWYLQAKSRTALAIAGVVTGIACLTRTANAVLGPFFALIAIVDVAIIGWNDRIAALALLRRYAIALLTIGAVTVFVFFVLWPAMWVAPFDTMSKLWSGSRELTESGADLDLYFRGKVSGDPGLLYYPVVLAHRLTGFTAVGGLIAIVCALRPRDLGERFNRRLAGNVGAFAVSYLVILSLSPKKLDRYVLPSVVALDLIAGLAWIAAAIWLARNLLETPFVSSRAVSAILVLFVLLGQTDYAIRMRPYYIDAALPLAGGVAGAQNDFSFNWGEGGKEVAEALEQISGIENAVVVAGPLQTTIDYYLPFRLNGPEYGSNLRTARVWMNTDYVVLSFPEIQRELYSTNLLAWFDQQQPVATVITKGYVYARIFDIRDVPPPDSFYSNVPKALWDGSMTVLAADYPDSRTVGAERIDASLYVQADVDSQTIQIQSEFVANDGTVAGRVTTTAEVVPGPDGIAKVDFSIPVPAGIAPQRYAIHYRFADPDTGAPLPGENLIAGQPITDLVSIGTVLIKPPKPPDDRKPTN